MVMMLRARALPIALALTAVSGLLVMGFIQSYALKNLQFVRQLKMATLASDYRSALVLGTSIPVEKEVRTLEPVLYPECRNEVRLTSFPWGVYGGLRARVIDPVNQDTIRGSYLLGHSLSEKPYALRVTSSAGRLRLAGDVLVKGKTILPGANIERFTGRGLPPGTKSVLPSKIDRPTNVPVAPSSYHLPPATFEGRNHEMQFLRLNALGPYVELSADYTAEPWQVFTATEELVVAPTARFENAILQAPIIRIASGKHGKLQAVATDSIIVESGGQLSYPSALLLKAIRPDACIYLHEKTSINGVVEAYPTSEDASVTAHLSKTTILRGALTVDGGVNLRGIIQGSVSAKRVFATDENRRVLHDVLYGVDISIADRPVGYLNPISKVAEQRLELLTKLP